MMKPGFHEEIQRISLQWNMLLTKQELHYSFESVLVCNKNQSQVIILYINLHVIRIIKVHCFHVIDLLMPFIYLFCRTLLCHCE